MQTWLRLKPELLPCIAQEADKVTRDYLTLVDQFRNGDSQAIQEILLLQIRARIDDFDKFYDQNFANPKIAYFERTKMKLRKLLHTHIESPDQEQPIQINYGGAESRGYDSRKEEQKNYSSTQRRQERSPVPKSAASKSRSPPQKSKSPVSNRNTMNSKTQQSPGNAKKTEEPKKKLNTQEDNEMVFTIKMTKQEYLEYQKTLKLKNGAK